MMHISHTLWPIFDYFQAPFYPIPYHNPFLTFSQLRHRVSTFLFARSKASFRNPEIQKVFVEPYHAKCEDVESLHSSSEHIQEEPNLIHPQFFLMLDVLGFSNLSQK